MFTNGMVGDHWLKQLGSAGVAIDLLFMLLFIDSEVCMVFLSRAHNAKTKWEMDLCSITRNVYIKLTMY